MCQDLFQYLLATGGPEQKTIIFCARDRHADDVAAVSVQDKNLNLMNLLLNCERY
jgi:type I site-specific restriction endonuclease